MAQGRVPLVLASGIDDPEHPIGTDATRVLAAINRVYSADGVVVLMDLGSAVLSAEAALEMLPPGRQAHVVLCEAPLVEGALAAAVQAAVGGTLPQVVNEARGALAAKAAQLQIAPDEAGTVATVTLAAPEQHQLRLTVRNRLGLHARPAARFVSTANQFVADIVVARGNRSALAKSINQVATLGVRQGDDIVVTAVGPDADAALAALQALAKANFGDVDDQVSVLEAVSSRAARPVVSAATANGELIGVGASPGIAIGPVFPYLPQVPEVVTYQAADPAAEWARLQAAIAATHQEIQGMQQVAIRRVGPAEAAIFEAHLLILQDPLLLETVRERLFEQRVNAEAAWQQVIEATAGDYRALDDAYMQGRAADVLDIGQRVLQHLTGLERPALRLEKPAILVARELTPSDTMRLDPSVVLGICTELGGATSHSAILARSLGIPAVVGRGPTLSTIARGQRVALDGNQGRLWLNPDKATLAQLKAEQKAWLAAQRQARAAGRQPATTKEGSRVEVGANIGGPHDTTVALEYGAEGVGLFRTEFLFLDRTSAPSEEEQLAVYRQVVEAMAPRPVIIRTLDVGGDKPLPYLELGLEENPFLGWRGIRFCLDRPEVFKPQLRAILRAGAGHSLKVMFPMVGALPELRAAKAVLAEVQAELGDARLPFNDALEVGIMIEVPAAVTIADQLAAEVDFFSIGTNDLAQYTMAADRGNARVAGLADALQPAVLRLVQQTVQAGHAAGVWVGMCGELAGEPLATPLLVGLGLDELSMNAPAIPAVKAAMKRWSRPEAAHIAQHTLSLETAAAVREYLASLG